VQKGNKVEKSINKSKKLLIIKRKFIHRFSTEVDKSMENIYLPWLKILHEEIVEDRKGGKS
jgi:hypothetical protein